MTTTIIAIVFDLVVLGVMLVSAFTDAKSLTVKPWTQFTMLALAVIHTVFVFGHYGKIAGFNCIASGVLLFVIYAILIIVFKGNGIGGGDWKMSSMLALYLGIIPTIIMVLGHVISAFIFVAYEKARKKKTVTSVPLMVFLTIGYLTAKIIEWL